MFESLVSLENVSFVLVFLGGILSFLSPCVLPLIPLYIGYLAGNAKVTNDDGSITYKRSKVLFHTICFVLGISTAFFILGLSFTTIGSFFNNNRIVFTRIAGIIIVILGLFQIGFFDLKFLQRQYKFNVDLKDKKINPIMAYIMGFTFSFAWTPCVGPALSSVLILASSAKSALMGNLLVLVYSLGFIIPFLILGMFTTQALNFIKNNKNIMKYTIKAGGIIMILMGIMTFTGWVNNISGYLSKPNNAESSAENSKNEEDIIDEDIDRQNGDISDIQEENNKEEKDNIEQDSDDENENQDIEEDAYDEDENVNVGDSKEENNEEDNIEQDGNKQNEGVDDTSEENSEEEIKLQDAIDFTLKDQYGNTHKLSDYKGKTVFLNFWATWCPPCKMEMPHIQELYEEFNYNNDDVIFIGVANPGGQEQDIQGIKEFLNDEGYNFPVVFDESGDVFNSYSISALPTTFMINEEGKVYGYVSGALSKDMMKNIIDETKEN